MPFWGGRQGGGFAGRRLLWIRRQRRPLNPCLERRWSPTKWTGRSAILVGSQAVSVSLRVAAETETLKKKAASQVRQKGASVAGCPSGDKGPEDLVERGVPHSSTTRPLSGNKTKLSLRSTWARSFVPHRRHHHHSPHTGLSPKWTRHKERKNATSEVFQTTTQLPASDDLTTCHVGLAALASVPYP